MHHPTHHIHNNLPLATLVLLLLLLPACNTTTHQNSSTHNTNALYTQTPQQIDAFLQDLHASTPNFRDRILAVATAQLGQPYDIYLLGEAPFEIDDAQPLFQLQKSDCVVFVEHTYAMALGNDWAHFFAYLQRLRYIDGRIGVVTRNHYTEQQWNPNNGWIVSDITDPIAGNAAVPYNAKANVAKFLRTSFNKQLDDWIIQRQTSYLPFAELDRAAGHVQTGDLVQIVRGTPPPPEGEEGEGINGRMAGAYVGHFGLMEVDADGTLWMIHSAAPSVQRERIADYAARSAAKIPEKIAAGKPQFLGFKFLALHEDAATRLQKTDGPHAPIVTFAPNRPLPRK